MTRQFLLIAALMGALGVALGAFGAHGLSDVLAANGRAVTFDTATEYHLVHALALTLVALLSLHLQTQWLRVAGYGFIAGIVLFSGSLYVLAILDVSIMGAVAPLGGVAFIIGWAALGMAGWQMR